MREGTHRTVKEGKGREGKVCVCMRVRAKRKGGKKGLKGI